MGSNLVCGVASSTPAARTRILGAATIGPPNGSGQATVWRHLGRTASMAPHQEVHLSTHHRLGIEVVGKDAAFDWRKVKGGDESSGGSPPLRQHFKVAFWQPGLVGTLRKAGRG